jgi:hypothetical protein
MNARVPIEDGDALEAAVESLRCEYAADEQRIEDAIANGCRSWRFAAVYGAAAAAIDAEHNDRIPIEKLALVGKLFVECLKVELNAMAMRHALDTMERNEKAWAEEVALERMES